ncbi:MAG: hypothetical protein JNM62_05200 [Flavobacteriales bacterium]|nr:hypothetical protein [Flavobacteriales bacterium]
MKLLGFDLKDRIQRRRFIILAVISNTLCLVMVARESFLDEWMFDKQRKATIDPKDVQVVIIGAGSWKWPDVEWEFVRPQRMRLKDRGEIDSFCRTVSSLPAKYIDNIRPMNNWVEIDVEFNDHSSEHGVIKQNYQDEIFLEFDGHSYEATPLKDWLRQLALDHE